MYPDPPKYATRFLRWFCREDHLEEIEGNLIELFDKRAENAQKQANRLFYWEVLLHFRPEYIRSLKGIQQLITYAMFKNYFKIAWRSMLKQKLYTSINIGGLSVGLTCFMLIFLYLRHELSYDRFFEKPDQIYRAFQRMEGNNYMGSEYWAYTTVGLAPTLREEFPEVSTATTIRDQHSLLTHREETFYEKGLWADGHFFDVLPYEMATGNPQQALQNEGSIVLTESLANKIFGSEPAMGNQLVFRDNTPVTVTGILKDPPATSSLDFSFLVSIRNQGQWAREIKENPWNNSDYYTFLRLKEGALPTDLESKFPAMLKKYWPNFDDYPFPMTYHVQPIKDLHFESNLNFDIGKKGNSSYVPLFSLVAALVLILACINYINLAIARSMKRSTEVGLRKVVGANRKQLVIQFLGESTLITLVSLVLALLLTNALTPFFGRILERPLLLGSAEVLALLPILLLLILVVGFMSGIYPALLMSGLRPIQVFKGKVERQFSGERLQKALMVGQYAISIGLIICSLVIYQQFQYIQNKELGYDRELVLTISRLDFRLRDKMPEIKEEWLSNPNITGVATAAELPHDVTSGTMLAHAHQEAIKDGFQIYRARHGFDYIQVFGLQLLAGRDFSPAIQSDLTDAIILNETAAAKLGWTPQEAVGKVVRDHKARTVIGVVKDFHQHSFHEKIAPLMLLMEDYFAYMAVKVRPENLSETIAFLEKSLQQHTPYPFQYEFLDDRFEQMYRAELKLGEIFGFFTLLSILIATLGLFGMAAYATTQRTKEIGIRKVLGASVKGIVGMLSKDFLKTVFIGFIVAIPFAWYGMNQWLQDFAYRIQMPWWTFLLAGSAAALIAFISVGSQSLKAALANPVDVLKDE